MGSIGDLDPYERIGNVRSVQTVVDSDTPPDESNPLLTTLF